VFLEDCRIGELGLFVGTFFFEVGRLSYRSFVWTIVDVQDTLHVALLCFQRALSFESIQGMYSR
jgi:hypothetical protein